MGAKEANKKSEVFAFFVCLCACSSSPPPPPVLSWGNHRMAETPLKVRREWQVDRCSLQLLLKDNHVKKQIVLKSSLLKCWC